MKTRTLEVIKEAYRIEADNILKMMDYIDEDAYEKAVELLVNAPRIGTCGCGHSGVICEHFSHLLCCIGRPAKYISTSLAVHGGTGFLKEGDVMVFASRGGKTGELIPILDICKKNKVHVITVTENLESPLALGADVVLKQFVTRETDPYNMHGTTSTTALSMVFHSLHTAMLEEMEYHAADFAVIHPGGAVGERLNNKALMI